MGNLQDLKNMVSAWLASRMPTPEMIREQNHEGPRNLSGSY